ncbi:MAG TPA: PDZ domain-containing protein, partial [Pirellulaceae bacterium]
MRIGLLTILMLICGLPLGAWAVDKDEPRERGFLELTLVSDHDESDDKDRERSEEAEPARKDRWIGVVCVPVDDALRSHLDIPEGAGLAVQMVVPDSPADEAGLEEHDILLEVNGDALGEQGMLMEAIRRAKDKSIELTWLHKGDEVTKDVMPAERPAEMAWAPEPPAEGSPQRGPVDENLLKAWVEQLERQGGQGQPFRMRFFGPGLEMGKPRKPFKGSLSVEINKENDAPARIKVRRGDESWEVTD